MITNKQNLPLKTLCIAQISDPHLFADTKTLHHGTNVFDNLTKVVSHIASNVAINVIIFTGDLTQDHSDLSYQRFVEVFEKQKRLTPHFNTPVYYLAGNHDEIVLLDKYLCNAPFKSNKTVNVANWQIQLIQSKSDSPAGFVTQAELQQLNYNIDDTKFQLLFMHHHPVDVDYFIDKHGLINQEQFWQHIGQLNQFDKVKAIACGHVHRGMKIPAYSKDKMHCVEVLTCPATSIQFDPSKTFVAALPENPAYRVIDLYSDGTLQTQLFSV